MSESLCSQECGRVWLCLWATGVGSHTFAVGAMSECVSEAHTHADTHAQRSRS